MVTWVIRKERRWLHENRQGSKNGVRLEILYISTFFPYPPDNGARIRIYNLLSSLAEKHHIHLISFFPPDSDQKDLGVVRSFCTRVEIIERDPFWRDPHQRLTSHLSLTPRDIIRGFSQEMEKITDQMVKHQKFDVVIASTLETSRYALCAKNEPHILEEQNFATRWMEERYQSQNNPLRRLASWITYQKCKRYEKRLYPYFNAVTMVSDQDKQSVRKVMPGYAGHLEVIPNGVDLEKCTPGLVKPSPDTLIYNGSLAYAANLDAMQYFSREIMPLIQEHRPQVQLIITGRNDGTDLSWLPPENSIRLSGYLDDVRPAVAGNWICVVPLRDGGGTRVKILEAMALGTPVVSTTKGAEGLKVIHGENILIADRPKDFADECIRLLGDEILRERLTINARRLVETCYDWKVIGRQFCDLVEIVAREGKSR